MAKVQVSERRWYLRLWSPRGHMKMSWASQISLLGVQGPFWCGSSLPPNPAPAACPLHPIPGPAPAPPLPSPPPDLAGVKQGEAAQEGDEAEQGGRYQHVGVPTEPGKVQGHLLTKVAPMGKAVSSGPPHKG